MANRYIYDKIVRDSTLSPIVSSDYHPSYSVENIRNIWTDYYYRTKYGNNSGWGYWEIDATKNKLYFNDGSDRTATITVDDYDADTVAAEIATQMTSVGGQTYTCVYSNTSRKFQISASGNFTLQCSTYQTNAIWADIGFSTASDKSGTNAYQGDYVRIHNGFAVEFESSDQSAITCSSCAVFGLNLTSAYQLLQCDRWTGSAWSKAADFEYDSTSGMAICSFTPQAGTKFRVFGRDWENASGYAQVGTVVCGEYKELSRGYEYGATFDIEESSVHKKSKKGYISVKVGYQTIVRVVEYCVMSEDEAKLEALYVDVGKVHPFVFVKNHADAINTMEFAIFRAKFGRREEDDFFKTINLAWEIAK